MDAFLWNPSRTHFAVHQPQNEFHKPPLHPIYREVKFAPDILTIIDVTNSDLGAFQLIKPSSPIFYPLFISYDIGVLSSAAFMHE